MGVSEHQDGFSPPPLACGMHRNPLEFHWILSTCEMDGNPMGFQWILSTCEMHENPLEFQWIPMHFTGTANPMIFQGIILNPKEFQGSHNHKGYPVML